MRQLRLANGLYGSPPAVPLLLLSHRIETSTISSFDRYPLHPCEVAVSASLPNVSRLRVRDIFQPVPNRKMMGSANKYDGPSFHLVGINAEEPIISDARKRSVSRHSALELKM
jgi:hypothetical protein